MKVKFWCQYKFITLIKRSGTEKYYGIILFITGMFISLIKPYYLEIVLFPHVRVSPTLFVLDTVKLRFGNWVRLSMNYTANPNALLPKIHVKGCIIQISSSLAINTDQINWVIAKSLLCFELQRHTFRAPLLHISKHWEHF